MSCRRSTNELKWPTRLVSIANDVVKLVLTTDWETSPHYATLSYCWGHNEFIKLTSDKLDSFLNNISYDDLPKTFKDAIYIARKLGLEYLWIDALCIIQDKDGIDDWLRESSQMRFVYGNAYINIAASSATNVYEGCFTKLKNHNGGFIARITTSEFCRVQHFYSMGVYEESTTETHLASRAWTFQEKLLAPRTLYFGSQGLFWECRSMTASEFLPDGIPGTFRPQLVRPADEAWNWNWIVSYYSKANLTQSADKLPALSGVARRQHEATGDEYLAGMWRKGLVGQLGWISRSKNQRPDWRAPTWSWTSIDAKISSWWASDINGLTMNEYVQVLDARTTLAGSDPFGAVSGGELQLRCTAMVRGHYCRPGNAEDAESGGSEYDRVMLDGKTRDIPVTMDCLEDDFLKASNYIYLLPLFEDKSGTRYKAIEENGSSAEEDSEDEVDGNYVYQLVIRGLVLQRSGPTKGHFRRIGAFDFRDPENDIEWKRDYYDDFLQAVKEFGASTAEDECAEIVSDIEHPESRYVITII